MPILTLQKRMHEAGRIRIGVSILTGGTDRHGNPKSRPKKLDTFRFTSGDRGKIEHIAQVLGGEPKPWRNGQLDQYEVITDATVIDVIVPPADMAFSQFLELWAGGGCQRRCDGQRETLSDQPCICGPDPDERECKPTTRLSVMIAQVQGAGLWRIETHGWYSASELAGSVELILSAAGRGHLLPATLRLDKRTVTRPGQPRRDFAVPVLDVKLPLAEIAQATAGALGTGVANGHGQQLPGASVAELEARTSETPTPFTPVPSTAPTRDRGTVADQVTEHQERADAGPKRTKRSAAPVASTGRKPRTVEQATADSPRTITSAQMTKLHAIFTEHNIDDRDERLSISAAVVGRDLDSSKDLTLTEAGVLIDTLERCAAAPDGFNSAVGAIVSGQTAQDTGVSVDVPDGLDDTIAADLVRIVTDDKRRTQPDGLTDQQAADLQMLADAVMGDALTIGPGPSLVTPEGVTVTVDQVRDLAAGEPGQTTLDGDA